MHVLVIFCYITIIPEFSQLASPRENSEEGKEGREKDWVDTQKKYTSY